MPAPDQAGRNRERNAFRPASHQVGKQDSEAAASGGCPSAAHGSNRTMRGTAGRSRLVPRPRLAATGASKAFGSIGRTDIRSAVNRQRVEKECFVSVHGPTDAEEFGPGTEETAVG